MHTLQAGGLAASAASTILIAGASGLIGAAAVEHFAQMPGWKVIGLSRRRPEAPAGAAFEHLALDLTDAAACRDAAASLGEVTHVIYAALFEKPGLVPGWYEHDQMQTNLAMMRNLMDPLLRSASGLRHMSVLQGTKAYGAHVHRIKVPARESASRDPHENFYWLQEDYVRAAQRRAAWAFTIWRPQVVFGAATGVAMNLIPVLGAYAAICRELRLPFYCPGEHGNIIEAVDADLIASALAWAAESPAARGETFNITNGDVFVWENVWPAIAEAVGLAPAFGQPVSLAEFLPRHAHVWDEIVAKHGLRPIGMAQLLGESHHYADLLFSYGARQTPASTLVSTIKLRQAGFGDCIDTEAMFRKWLGRLADRKILPRP
ncbi:MAG: NAD-dependent epimerase/dehydratase family protein [Caulobacterales bacterium]